MIVTILAFLFILAFSITIHEFGHFIIAKLFRIPVEKFSIGYGPPLVRKQIGETDFRIAYFPLGGYVKIAGEDEGVISDKAPRAIHGTEGGKKVLKGTESTDTQKTLKNTESTEENTAQKALKDNEGAEQKDALKTLKEGHIEHGSRGGVPGFYDAPIYKRVLIVLAGPFFNIISSVFVFIVVLAGFGLLVNPYMRIEVEPGSLAEEAGLFKNDSIITVAGQGVTDWDGAFDILYEHDGDIVDIGFVRDGTTMETKIRVALDSLGIQPLVPPVLGNLKLDGPAQKAGMKPGNRILRIDGTEIESWNQMVDTVRGSVGVPLNFVWLDNGVENEAVINPVAFYDPTTEDTIGQIGAIMPLQRRYLSLPDVVSLAVQRSGEVLWLTLKTLYQLIIGRISRRAIGGPIAIAQLSGESARWGFENLLGLLAIISINLGLINLFPIPALDGGHVVISIIEAIRNKRFSRRTRLIIQQIGYAIILLLVVFVTFNDITR